MSEVFGRHAMSLLLETLAFVNKATLRRVHIGNADVSFPSQGLDRCNLFSSLVPQAGLPPDTVSALISCENLESLPLCIDDEDEDEDSDLLDNVATKAISSCKQLKELTFQTTRDENDYLDAAMSLIKAGMRVARTQLITSHRVPACPGWNLEKLSLQVVSNELVAKMSAQPFTKTLQTLTLLNDWDKSKLFSFKPLQDLLQKLPLLTELK